MTIAPDSATLLRGSSVRFDAEARNEGPPVKYVPPCGRGPVGIQILDSLGIPLVLGPEPSIACPAVYQEVEFSSGSRIGESLVWNGTQYDAAGWSPASPGTYRVWARFSFLAQGEARVVYANATLVLAEPEESPGIVLEAIADPVRARAGETINFKATARNEGASVALAGKSCADETPEWDVLILNDTGAVAWNTEMGRVHCLNTIVGPERPFPSGSVANVTDSWAGEVLQAERGPGVAAPGRYVARITFNSIADGREATVSRDLSLVLD